MRGPLGKNMVQEAIFGSDSEKKEMFPDVAASDTGAGAGSPTLRGPHPRPPPGTRKISRLAAKNEGAVGTNIVQEIIFGSDLFLGLGPKSLPTRILCPGSRGIIFLDVRDLPRSGGWRPAQKKLRGVWGAERPHNWSALRGGWAERPPTLNWGRAGFIQISPYHEAY